MLDCVVVGLGAAGSAALGALARDGASVSGVDRFAPPHVQGRWLRPADRDLTGLDDILAIVDGHVQSDGFLEGVKEA